ncbi:hypothetical protein Peur_025335 [Populus x canadensis]
MPKHQGPNWNCPSQPRKRRRPREDCSSSSSREHGRSSRRRQRKNAQAISNSHKKQSHFNAQIVAVSFASMTLRLGRKFGPQQSDNGRTVGVVISPKLCLKQDQHPQEDKDGAL